MGADVVFAGLLGCATALAAASGHVAVDTGLGPVGVGVGAAVSVDPPG
ncbi:hypothetical protein ONA92_26695 [Mycobacteroides salmoniphilum]